MHDTLLLTTHSVLVTRPHPAGEQLCQAIQRAGGHAYYFPTIEIVPLPESKEVMAALSTLDQADWLIFVSPQAVYTSIDAIQKAWPRFPQKVKIAAIGDGTASVLRNAGLPVTAVPADDWRSEGLLRLPVFQHLEGQKILLFHGEAGRDYLVEQLKERGATVNHVVTYRRALPQVDVTKTVKLIQSHQINLVVCTSGEGIINLKKLLSSEWDVLRHIPLLVISERMQSLAKSEGFERVILAKNASQDAIMETLQQYEQKGSEPMPSQPETETAKQRSFPWSGIGIFLSLLVLAALLVTAYLGERRLLVMDAAMAALNVDISNKMRDNQTAISALQNQANTMQQTLQAAKDSINDIRNTTQNNKAVWTVSEAQYLTRLANDNLQLGTNIPLVIHLLQTADQEIANLSDAKVLSIRKALAADIAALQAVPNVDASGIYMQLSALNEQIDKLPFINRRPIETAPAAETPASDQTWWKRGLKDSWKTLRQIVVVRYTPSDQVPFIAPDQQQYLAQNIHTLLLQTMSAVMNKQPEIYRDSLQKTHRWIKEYYMQDSPLTVSVLKNLETLQTLEIRPSLPALTASLDAFRDYLGSVSEH